MSTGRSLPSPARRLPPESRCPVESSGFWFPTVFPLGPVKAAGRSPFLDLPERQLRAREVPVLKAARLLSHIPQGSLGAEEASPECPRPGTGVRGVEGAILLPLRPSAPAEEQTAVYLYAFISLGGKNTHFKVENINYAAFYGNVGA